MYKPTHSELLMIAFSASVTFEVRNDINNLELADI